ncbi:Matrixin [Candidatus Nitrososphaera evergladensis SR1]|uniref:Matrixin n=3 Tax=Nitrososphaera TaxID=497726 RepID=A0A075MYK2_9ARCH|nr:MULTISPECIES: matrixin family metalloprotease [Nitrososphaera]AIC14994.1 putative secreted metalloprotease [Nitrososphaera viennensis EN76]AIF84344.1 Matrixin [Candidatus Nitrososphaera evergladensis SR1]UVS69929.1 hypothetical protein NWT39_03865 [Nitrososphaera viennensis]
MLRVLVPAFLFIATLLSLVLFLPSASAVQYYKEQTDFTETKVPTSGFTWSDSLHVCIFKQAGVPNSYYAWAKLAVQEWRQALREYTGDQQGWTMTARYSPSELQMGGCNVRVHIYNTYKDFPEYPRQTGAYTAVQYTGGDAESANVYLSPQVLHGDGKTEIKLPNYAFRNSAVHEMGHVLGLGHMGTEKGYLMSPVFDYFEHSDQLPITTLELSALVGLYGTDGFERTISIL